MEDRLRSDSALSLWLGIGCVVLGVLLNRWTLGYLLAADHTIESPGARAIILAFQAALIGLGLYLAIKRPPLFPAELLLMSASSLVFFVAGLVLVQVFYSPPPVVSGWRAGGTPLEKNQLGYRGHPIAYTEKDYVVVLLGDSNVEAKACSYDYLPERRLEYHLRARGKNVRVFTLGASGYGQDQQLLALKEYYTRYRADLLVLWQTPLNDVWNNIFPTHWPTNANPKPTFWLEDGQLKGPTEQIGEPLAYPAVKVLSFFDNLTPSISKRDTLWESRLPAAYQPMTEYSGPVSREWQERWDSNPGWRLENLDNEKSHVAMYLTPQSPRMKYGLELTRRLLQEIEKLALANKGELVIFRVNPPKDELHPDDGTYVLNGKYYRTSKRQLAENLGQLNVGLKNVDVPVSLEKWRVGPANAHFNEHATDEAMKNLSSLLEQMIRDR